MLNQKSQSTSLGCRKNVCSEVYYSICIQICCFIATPFLRHINETIHLEIKEHFLLF